MSIPLHRRKIAPDIKHNAIEALVGVRVSRQAATRAWGRWRNAYPAERCKFGAEQAIAVDCDCPGCIEKLCFLYFDQVATTFGLGAK